MMNGTITKISILTALVTLSISFSSHSETKFDSVDNMIKRLESTSQLKKIPTKVETPDTRNYVVSDPQVVDVGKLPKPASFHDKKIVKTTAQITPALPKEVEKGHGQQRLSELPPHTRFEFNRNVFIPAYKSGVLFVSGHEKGIERDVDVERLFLNMPNESNGACALLSNKSYVMMRGVDSSLNSKPTYLEVAHVQFLEGINSANETVLLSKIEFSTKSAKNSDIENGGVSISLTCLLPNDAVLKPADYTLDNLNKSMDNLFSFQLPKFIEI